MEMIKAGKIPSRRIWEGKCGHCGAEFTATQEEIKIHDTQMDGEWGEAKCSYCKKGTVIFYPTGKYVDITQIPKDE